MRFRSSDDAMRPGACIGTVARPGAADALRFRLRADAARSSARSDSTRFPDFVPTDLGGSLLL
eukprot:9498587-Pyramimonas_sp.AAC.1